ncbi:NADH-quinone oxidoreductase subunit J [Candidatus Terasakiella magnetica]|uniref:NADH-quinone oxidoreductase subunit J n=1 Tax=Candidatus Terasakiella magnetica TaxID=1867952 RepID=A0A1C3RCJ2_9PROT|nr:NADH-quinone oxidoreductase subunit J [Candidatus Terasakiella magnetica]SCA54997.1 NADH-quinone oxidoreductase subunit J [Candidatus Terasakiella magnetica]
MIVQALAFYLFAAVTVGSAVMVITAKNPVHSVLFLVLALFNVAGLFVLLGAEFLAMLLVVVYAGAVTVLFLFVVMMLDINFVELRQGFLQYMPLGASIGIIVLAELAVVAGGWHFAPDVAKVATAPTPPIETMTNTHALGAILYTDYIYLFQAAGLVLLVGMIGAIVLTHRKRPGVRKQVIADQVNLKVEDVAEFKKVEIGKGV